MLASNLPTIRSAIMAWAQTSDIWIVCKRQQDFKTIESYSRQTVKIFRDPTGQALEMKAEGQRKWNTETIYADNALNVKVDDVLIFGCKEGERYRVLNKTDYSEYGYIKLDVTSDYNK